MSDILCVTNRLLAKDDFLDRIRKIASAHPAGILLREKDLTEEVYTELAEDVLAICRQYGTPCILHNFVNAAKTLGHPALHVPLPVLRSMPEKTKAMFTTLGASCHSAEEAIEAEQLGCTYITAGHVFDTDCKKGLSGRGLEFLRTVCVHVSIPVYGIGGISADNIAEVRKTGAAGACVMSGAMVCTDVHAYFAAFEEKNR